MGKINYKNKQNKELGGLVNNLGYIKANSVFLFKRSFCLIVSEELYQKKREVRKSK